MSAVISSYVEQLKEARENYFQLQNRLVSIHNNINDSIMQQKRIEAELAEIDALDDDAVVYKQVSRMFSRFPTKTLRDELKAAFKKCMDEFPTLQSTEADLKKRVVESQKVCIAIEEKLRESLQNESASQKEAANATAKIVT